MINNIFEDMNLKQSLRVYDFSNKNKHIISHFLLLLLLGNNSKIDWIIFLDIVSLIFLLMIEI